MSPIQIALVGMGKIAHDQHVPAILGNDRFALVATVDPNPQTIPGVLHAPTLAALLANSPPVDAVVLCTPPQARYGAAALALDHGLHVFLEKPPGVTLSEVEALRGQAAKRGVTLFAGWHSRFAAAVEPARAWLHGRRIERVSVVWREDVRVWHPGQGWIWEPGGFGAFDPGINALSILTHILPHPFYATRARLAFPANRAAPIAADVVFQDTVGTEITMDLDFRQTGPQTWDITVATDAGVLTLTSGGAVLSLPDGAVRSEDLEYQSLYQRFEELIRTGSSEVDTRPLQLVADAFLCGERQVVEAFYD